MAEGMSKSESESERPSVTDPLQSISNTKILSSSDAPIMSMTLEGPPNLPLNQDYPYSIKLTYHGFPPTNANSDRSECPITFYQNIVGDLIEGEKFSIFHISSQGLQLFEVDPFPCRFIQPEDEDEPRDLTVGESVESGADCFQTLFPGQSYEIRTTLADTELDGDARFEVGKKYVFRYNGDELEWWDWGTKEVRLKARF